MSILTQIYSKPSKAMQLLCLKNRPRFKGLLKALFTDNLLNFVLYGA